MFLLEADFDRRNRGDMQGDTFENILVVELSREYYAQYSLFCLLLIGMIYQLVLH